MIKLELIGYMASCRQLVRNIFFLSFLILIAFLWKIYTKPVQYYLEGWVDMIRHLSSMSIVSMITTKLKSEFLL
jgi:hypothetical protein